MNESDFLLHFRVHKESFWKLLDYIKDFEGFKRSTGEHGVLYTPQAPVKYQLLIFLYVLGATGSDAQYRKIRSRFNISVGTIHLYVDRCTDAVLQILEKDAVHWPDATSQKEIAR